MYQDLTDAERKIVLQAHEIIARYAQRDDQQFTSPSIAREFVKTRLALQDREVFGVAFLDTRHRLIAWEDMFLGTIDGAEVHPRIVARQALKANAAAVIIAHNHPSGDPTPSAADRMLTSRLREVLSIMDIRLLDHLVVGGNNIFSFAEHGML